MGFTKSGDPFVRSPCATTYQVKRMSLCFYRSDQLSIPQTQKIRRTKGSMYLLDIQVTVCLGHSLGEIICTSFIVQKMTPQLCCVSPLSAQVVADMILADLEGKEWSIPDWLPRHYLTKIIGGAR